MKLSKNYFQTSRKNVLKQLLVQGINKTERLDPIQINSTQLKNNKIEEEEDEDATDAE